MKRQQKIALAYPCELAEQTSNRRYLSATRKGDYGVSTILTVNVGEE